MRSMSKIYNDYFSSTAVFSYKEDERIFRTRFMRAWFVILLIIVAFMLVGSSVGIGANEYHYFIMNLILINLIASIGLQLLIGFTGLLSLGLGLGSGGIRSRTSEVSEKAGVVWILSHTFP